MKNMIFMNLTVNNALASSASANSNTVGSSEFVKILDNVSENGILTELQKRYSKNIINFEIAQECMVKMGQNDKFKKNILDKIDSFFNSSFVKLHPNLSYEVQIDANGKIAYSIEVPKLEDEDDKTVKEEVREVWNQDNHQYMEDFISAISSCSINEIIEIKNRLKLINIQK